MPYVAEVLPCQAEFLEYEGQMMAIRGGIRSGKSVVIAYWMLVRMERYPDGGHFAVGADLPQLKRGFLRTFTSMLNDYGIAHEYRAVTGDVIIKHSGARLQALSAEVRERIRSTEMDSVLLEEPQTWRDGLECYRVIVGRLSGSPGGKKYRAQGMQPQMRLSFNPTAIGSWLWELLERQRVMPCLQYSVRNNFLMSNHAEYVALQESILPPDLWSVELEGHWGTAGGAVYRYFNSKSHATPLPGLPPLAFDPTKPLELSCDFNIGLQCSVVTQTHAQRKSIVGYTDPGIGGAFTQRKPIVEREVLGAQEVLLYVLGELRIPDCSTYQMVPIWLERYGEWARKAPCVKLYGDATGGARGQQTAESNYEIILTLLSQAGIRVEYHVPKSNPLELDRINAFNCMLYTGDGVGLYIDHDRAPYLVADLQTVCFREGTNEIDKRRDLLLTHLSDALGYRIADLRKERSSRDTSQIEAFIKNYVVR